MKLIHIKTKKEVKIGDKVKSFHEDAYTITGWQEPHKESSTGRVNVESVDGFGTSFFPAVVQCEFIKTVEIPVFQLIQWKHAIKLEGLGMKHSSGRSVTAHAKKVLGVKGNRAKVLARVEAELAAARLARTLVNEKP